MCVTSASLITTPKHLHPSICGGRAAASSRRLPAARPAEGERSLGVDADRAREDVGNQAEQPGIVVLCQRGVPATSPAVGDGCAAGWRRIGSSLLGARRIGSILAAGSTGDYEPQLYCVVNLCRHWVPCRVSTEPKAVANVCRRGLA